MPSADRVLWRHAAGALDCSRGRLVGIVNATPDSFTDQGAHFGTGRAVAHGRRLAAQGADVVEVGGESLRFSAPTPEDVEAARVVPVIDRLVREIDVPVAVDTFKPAVAERALAAGAAIVNDPTGLRDPRMARAVARAGAGIVLTHFFGPPKVRPQRFPEGDVPALVVAWARERLERAAEEGVAPERVVLDPGIGLGTAPPQDLEMLRRIGELVALGRPVLVPVSNKKVLGAVTGRPAKRRLAPTAAALAWCRGRGATVFRVHNVRFLRGALEMADALADGSPGRWHEVVK